MGDNVVSYETFRKYQRLEQENESLQPLPFDFYDSYKKWLARKEDLFVKTKEPIIEREIVNAKRIIEEIFEKRQKKILILADHSTRSDVELKNMLPGEIEYFRNISDVLKRFKIDTLLGSPAVDKNEEREVEVKTEVKSFSMKEGYLLVRMIDDLGQFAWLDGIAYGPLKNGDLVTLPKEVAEMLSKKEKVEILNPQM